MQWEVEALEPAEMQRLVLSAVDPYIDRQVLAQQIAHEEDQHRPAHKFDTLVLGQDDLHSSRASMRHEKKVPTKPQDFWRITLGTRPTNDRESHD
ncbi:hypothetical protein GCM10023080_067340 [Streptomyces pseudoechinosporeus]